LAFRDSCVDSNFWVHTINMKFMDYKKQIIYGIFGAGGFGREVMPVARQMLENSSNSHPKKYELFFVNEEFAEPKVVNGHKLINKQDFISLQADQKYFNIAISNYKVRERISTEMIQSKIYPFTIKAANTVVMDENKIGPGAILSPFTTITSNAKIGNYFHSNIYSYVAHDCIIGDFVTFAPNVHCNGNVIIEDYAYIGTGAIIKHGTEEKKIKIGKGAIIGMGAVVTKNVPPFTTVIGNPASELKQKINHNARIPKKNNTPIFNSH